MFDRLHRSVSIISVTLLALMISGSAAPSPEEQFLEGMLSSEESRQQKRIIVDTTSGEAELALVAHLNQIGATLYGAYWCVHCQNQAALFGQEAFEQIRRIECAPDGMNAQPELCQEAGVEAYPTWEINDQFYGGSQSLEELAHLSGYDGSRNFSVQE